MKNRLGNVIRSTKLTRWLIAVTYILTIYLGAAYCTKNQLSALNTIITLVLTTLIYALVSINDFTKKANQKQALSSTKLIEKKLRSNPWEVYLKLVDSNVFLLKSDMIKKTDNDMDNLTKQFTQMEKLILDNVSSIEQNLGQLTLIQKQEFVSCIDQLTDVIKKNAWYVRSGLQKSMTELTTANELPSSFV